MLDRVLDFFSGELNAYFQAKTGIIGDTVLAGAIVNDSGKYAIQENSIAATIINIEEDAILRDQLSEVRYQQNQHIKLEPKLKLNITVLFSANYTKYDQALKHLSLVLSYFQSQRVFTRTHFPNLDSSIERLSVEMQTLSYDQLNQIWAYVGGKHLPSVVYRVRFVSIQDESLTHVQPPLTTISIQAGGQ